MAIVSDPLLLKASQLIRRKKFGLAIHLLETEIVRYHDSPRFYYLLGTACLYAGDYGGALTYFKRGRELKLQDPHILAGLAVLHLRRGETERAIELYLDILEKDPHHRLAQRGLQFIRKHGDPEKLLALVEEGRLISLYPPLPTIPRSRRKKFLLIAGLIGGGSLLYGVGLIGGLFPNPLLKPRPGIDQFVLLTEEKIAPLLIGETYHLILTQGEILRSYERALRLFSEYRDEAAKVEINRILLSNAGEPIKNKARLLKNFAVTPGFDTLRDRFSYEEVMKDPLLYQDVYVLWRGMATNVVVEDQQTFWDFLVGYDTKQVLQGIIPVRCEFAVDVDVEKPLEVLGQIIVVPHGRAVFSSSPAKNKLEDHRTATAPPERATLYLRGIAVHQSKVIKPEK
ncbi:MAG: tetratricopeptide repeat protein [Treponemataceae bacterium]|nr:tetratricopeptide repeat protein [Treponemataceae bacterium]